MIDSKCHVPLDFDQLRFGRILSSLQEMRKGNAAVQNFKVNGLYKAMWWIPKLIVTG